MTYEEAKKNITAYVYAECENIPMRVIKALDVAREALEKQMMTELKFCPNCGRTMAVQKWIWRRMNNDTGTISRDKGFV